jgi:hypothetical protein
VTDEPPRPDHRAAEATPGGDAEPPHRDDARRGNGEHHRGGNAEPQLPAASVPDPHPAGQRLTIAGTDAEAWQSALGAVSRLLPEGSGRTARGDVDRLARGDAQRQVRATERTGGDTDRTSRIRSATRSTRAPQRVRVTSPRMAATARGPVRTVGREIDEQTGVGEVYLRSLLRAQLRLGLSVIAVIALALGTLPLVFAVIPRLGMVRVFTVPLPWLLVGVSVYPLLFGVAWWHVLATERAERDFAAIVESD